jgi:hypothetical protein
MFVRGDTVRLSKPGVEGQEVKKVHSFEDGLLVFENGKRLRLPDPSWVVERVGPKYKVEFEGCTLEVVGELSVYREDNPPWDVAEDAESETLPGGQVLVRDELGLVSFTRSSATSGPEQS